MSWVSWVSHISLKYSGSRDRQQGLSRSRQPGLLPACVALATLALLVTACGSSPGTQSVLKATQSVVKNARLHLLRATNVPSAWGVSVPGAGPCNPLGGEQCMLPFPSNYYTVPDHSMASGVQIDFPARAMPANSHGVRIDPATWSRNDGFSPGSGILVSVPNLDLAASRIPTSATVGASLRRGSPIVLLDASTGARLAYWAELDIRNPNPATRLLIIHPAANLPEGHRIIVVLRNLTTTAGAHPSPPPAFNAIVHHKVLAGTSGAAVTKHIDGVLADLRVAGVSTRRLYLAWDFTVISRQNLTGWMLHMRDQALAGLHGGVPAFQVTAVKNFTSSANPEISRQVIGTLAVPSYLNKPGGPMGSTFNFGPDGLPQQLPGNVQHVVFACLIPRSADPNPSLPSQPVHPGQPVLYGKGLFSLATEMDASGVLASADRFDLVQCSISPLGLDANDELYDAGIIQNLSGFAAVPDRLQQAILSSLFLERLMASPTGLASNPAFRSDGGRGKSLIDTAAPLTYYGNSEGSLLGGAVTAVSTQVRRAVLGVPSMNYSILLDRSVDFTGFSSLFGSAYPSHSEQLLALDLMQMLWDRGETNGYVEQLTNHPLPGTPPHQVLLQMVFGDHQVANVSTEIEARTIGAVIHVPILRPHRAVGDPFWGIPKIRSYPYTGSAALFLWDDVYVAPPPAGNVPPEVGPDPHDYIPRSVPAAQDQLVHFLDTGQVINVCGAAPCVTSIKLPPGG